MKPSAVAVTSKDIFDVFAMWQVQQLEQQVKNLRLRLYHRTLPPLRCVLYEYNKMFSECSCLACKVGARVEEDDDFWEDSVSEQCDCSFAAQFEKFCANHGVSFGKGAAEAWAGDGKFSHGCPSALCADGPREDWVLCAWGRPLSSLDSPRRKQWEFLLEEMDFEHELGELQTV